VTPPPPVAELRPTDAGVTLSLGGESGASAGPQAVAVLARDAEELRRLAALAKVRDELEALHETHRVCVERATALPTMGVCPATDVVADLGALGDYWFSPATVDAIYAQIAERSEPLVREATELGQHIAADAAALNDPATPASIVARERLAGLRKRIEDTERELRGLYAELASGLAAAKARVESRERTAQAVRAIAVAPAEVGCVMYCRKVAATGRGDVYFTLTHSHVVFHPVRTSGALFWKSETIGTPEVLPLDGGLTVTDVRQPLLGDHTITLRQGGATGPGLEIWAGRQAIDDLLAVAAGG
jgi:hypothetical protein